MSNNVVTIEYLQGLVDEAPPVRGMQKIIIAKFASDPDEPTFVDVSTMPCFSHVKTVGQLKALFKNALPPVAENAPKSWEKIVVRTPVIENDDGTSSKHVYLLHIDRITASVAAKAQAKSQ